MNACVLDASAVLAVLVEGQSSPAAQAFFEHAEDPWLAPELMRLEVRNALRRLERRGVLDEGAADARLVLLEASVDFASGPDAAALAGIVALSRRSGLGVYDGVYLDLAVRAGASLASRDAALLAAADGAGVTVRDLR